MRKLITAILVYVSTILFPSTDILAQSGAPFLKYAPSPYSLGIGGAGVALPTDDPFKAFHNPALLGLSENNSNLSTSFYLQPAQLYGSSNLQYSNYAINTGYDLGKINEDIPLFVGISFIRQNIDIGEFTMTDENGQMLGKFSLQQYANSFSIGIGYSYYVDFAVGFTYKDINSGLTPTSVIGQSKSNANAGAYDLGILLSYPVLSSYDLGNAFSANLNISSGWSINNVGDKLNYSQGPQSLLLPRQAGLGYAVRSDLTYKLKDIPFKLLTAEWTMEANDLLINTGTVPLEYESGLLGDINVVDDIISGKSHDNVVIRRGFRATIAELFSISIGSYKFNSWIEYFRESYGWTVHTNGLFKVLNAYFGNVVFDFLASHIDIRYIYGQHNFESKTIVTENSVTRIYGYQTEFSGLELRIINVVF